MYGAQQQQPSSDPHFRNSGLGSQSQNSITRQPREKLVWNGYEYVSTSLDSNRSSSRDSPSSSSDQMFSSRVYQQPISSRTNNYSYQPQSTYSPQNHYSNNSNNNNSSNNNEHINNNNNHQYLTSSSSSSSTVASPIATTNGYLSQQQHQYQQQQQQFLQFHQQENSSNNNNHHQQLQSRGARRILDPKECEVCHEVLDGKEDLQIHQLTIHAELYDDSQKAAVGPKELDPVWGPQREDLLPIQARLRQLISSTLLFPESPSNRVAASSSRNIYASMGFQTLPALTPHYHPQFKSDFPTPLSWGMGVARTWTDQGNAVSASNESKYRGFIGQWRGIQGEANSCYIDSALFGMFAFCDKFDVLILSNNNNRNGNRNGNESGKMGESTMQMLLADTIIRPLRQRAFVPCTHVLRWRQLLDDYLPNNDVMKGACLEREFDEFVNALAKAFQFPPLVKMVHRLSSGAIDHISSNYWQLLPPSEGDIPNHTSPTIQQLLEISFGSRHEAKSHFLLVDRPQTLVLQTPRGGSDRILSEIIPSLYLDISKFSLTPSDGTADDARLTLKMTLSLNNVPLEERQIVCVKLRWGGGHEKTLTMNVTPWGEYQVHMEVPTDTPVHYTFVICKIGFPEPVKIDSIPRLLDARDFATIKESWYKKTHTWNSTVTAVKKCQEPPAQAVPHLLLASEDKQQQGYLTLSAVLCIGTNHYVTFARCSNPPESEWVFFDSMSARDGGHCVPVIKHVPGLGRCMEKVPWDPSALPTPEARELAQRLCRDMYVAIYT